MSIVCAHLKGQTFGGLVYFFLLQTYCKYPSTIWMKNYWNVKGIIKTTKYHTNHFQPTLRFTCWHACFHSTYTPTGNSLQQTSRFSLLLLHIQLSFTARPNLAPATTTTPSMGAAPAPIVSSTTTTTWCGAGFIAPPVAPAAPTTTACPHTAKPTLAGHGRRGLVITAPHITPTASLAGALVHTTPGPLVLQHGLRSSQHGRVEEVHTQVASHLLRSIRYLTATYWSRATSPLLTPTSTLVVASTNISATLYKAFTFRTLQRNRSIYAMS